MAQVSDRSSGVAMGDGSFSWSRFANLELLGGDSGEVLAAFEGR